MKKAPNILTTFSFFEKRKKKKKEKPIIKSRGSKKDTVLSRTFAYSQLFTKYHSPMQGRNRTYNSKFRSKTFSTLRLEYGVQMNDKSF